MGWNYIVFHVSVDQNAFFVLIIQLKFPTCDRLTSFVSMHTLKKKEDVLN